MAQTLTSRLYRFLNVSKGYAAFSFIVVLTSLIPLAFKDQSSWLIGIEYVTTAIFIVDYLARWICANKKLEKGKLSFLIYPFTPMAIIDLITILPTFILLNQGFKTLRIIRLVLLLRLFRFAKESRSFNIIIEVIKKEKAILGVVCLIAIAYIFITALIMFNVEPDTFETFFDAIYWACVSLTTVGYGDLYPISVFGRVIAMISAMVGIAVIALPAGIITGGYIDVMREERK